MGQDARNIVIYQTVNAPVLTDVTLRKIIWFTKVKHTGIKKIDCFYVYIFVIPILFFLIIYILVSKENLPFHIPNDSICTTRRVRYGVLYVCL